jgi:hypothetical protein
MNDRSYTSTVTYVFVTFTATALPNHVLNPWTEWRVYGNLKYTASLDLETAADTSSLVSAGKEGTTADIVGRLTRADVTIRGVPNLNWKKKKV